MTLNPAAQPSPSYAPALAAAAGLFEMGDRLGLMDGIKPGVKFVIGELARKADLPTAGVSLYVEALEAAGIVVRQSDAEDTYMPSEEFGDLLYEAGYVSWVMNANRPFIENAHEYLSNPTRESGAYERDGRQVAVSSEWMGSQGIYPAALSTVLDAKPERVADLGSGTCRLLIDVLVSLPGCSGMGLDLNGPSCVAARAASQQAGVEDRLEVFERPIQSLVEDDTPVRDADVIHAGFVFHDMMPDEEDVADQVLATCRRALRPGGIMAITEGLPYLQNDDERRFSAAWTFFHRAFMKRKPLSADEWRLKLEQAGFQNTDVIKLGFPGARLFVSRK